MQKIDVGKGAGRRTTRRDLEEGRQPFACRLIFPLVYPVDLVPPPSSRPPTPPVLSPDCCPHYPLCFVVPPPTLQVKMSAADSARARAFFCLYAALDFFTPVIMAGLILLTLSPFAKDGVLEGAPLSETTRVFTSAAWRVVGLCFVGMVSMAVMESCE